MKISWLMSACAALVCLAGEAAAETIAIVNARVVTMGPSGAMEKGVVLIRNGEIVAVGAEVEAPEDARIIDAEGRFLTPGLVATITPLALLDTIGFSFGGRDARGPVTAGFSVADDVNPNNPQIPEARIEGVTRAVVVPNAQGAGKLFGGEAAVIHLGQGMSLVTDRHAAIFLSAGERGSLAAGGGRGAIRERLADALNQARRYRRDPSGFDSGREAADGLTSRDLRALVRVIEGDEPLLVHVDRAADILTVLSIMTEERISIVLTGVAEGWMVADQIAAAGVPVVIDAEENDPENFDKLNSTYENAALLVRAGVLVSLQPGIARLGVSIRTPRFNAGRAVRYGLSWHDALAAVTIHPARIFGFEDHAGSIEVGKEADLVLWSGDPLETTTVARMVMIRGVEQPLTARNRMLRDRYLPTLRARETAAPESVLNPDEL